MNISRSYFSVLGIVFLSFQALAQCPPSDGSITFKSQEEVNAFLADYPDCTEIETQYGLILLLNNNQVGTPINDLRPFSNLVRIKGGLRLEKQPNNASHYGDNQYQRLPKTGPSK